MNIFEQLDDIVNKKQNKLAENLEDESEFVPFMAQRWLSMHSPHYAEILNVSSNRAWRSLGNDKQLWYKYFISIIPRGNSKHFRYIKKASKSPHKKIDDDIITMLAERLEVSKREIKLYIEADLIDISVFKKQINS